MQFQMSWMIFLATAKIHCWSKNTEEDKENLRYSPSSSSSSSSGSSSLLDDVDTPIEGNVGDVREPNKEIKENKEKEKKEDRKVGPWERRRGRRR